MKRFTLTCLIVLMLGLTPTVVTTIPSSAPAPAAHAATAEAQAVYRFWSPVLRSHFYTMSVDERDGIISRYSPGTWQYEGPKFGAFATQVPGTVPLFRFWSARFGGHFYTTDEAEKAHIQQVYDTNTWGYEGVAFYVYPTTSTVTDTRVVARFFSPTYVHHFYTADAAEADYVKRSYPKSVWTWENDNFRVPATTPAGVAAPVRYDGSQRVGVDMPPGRYRAIGGPECYWERLSGFGGTEAEIISNEYGAAGQRVVDVKSGDVGFGSYDCGGFTLVAGTESSAPRTAFAAGEWIVGREIAAGTYRTTTANAECYWARLSGAGGEQSDIIADDFLSGPQVVVTISASDALFDSEGCGTWVRQD